MKIKKVVFLFLALLLPVLVYLFLKSFGKNEFTVTPLFQDSVKVSALCKGIEYKTPYTIPDSVFDKLQSQSNRLLLVVLADSTLNTYKDELKELSRVRNEFVHDLVSIEVLNDKSNYRELKECVFLLVENNAVLVDVERRIVGQYNIADLDETDRLILELKILLKKY